MAIELFYKFLTCATPVVMDNCAMHKIIFLLGMACLVGAPQLQANDCSPWEIERAYASTTAIFVGRIENIGKRKNTTDHSTEPIRFKVGTVYKGHLRRIVTIWTLPDWEWYGYAH